MCTAELTHRDHRGTVRAWRICAIKSEGIALFHYYLVRSGAALATCVSVLCLGFLTYAGTASAHNPHPGPVTVGGCTVDPRDPKVEFSNGHANVWGKVRVPPQSGCGSKKYIRVRLCTNSTGCGYAKGYQGPLADAWLFSFNAHWCGINGTYQFRTAVSVGSWQEEGALHVDDEIVYVSKPNCN